MGVCRACESLHWHNMPQLSFWSAWSITEDSICLQAGVISQHAESLETLETFPRAGGYYSQETFKKCLTTQQVNGVTQRRKSHMSLGVYCFMSQISLISER